MVSPQVTAKVTEEKIQIASPDGAVLALWKISCPSGEPKGSVLLTHGTCSDLKICSGLARYLAKQNWTAWVLEWREHGNSGKSPTPFDMETIAYQDLKTAIHFVCDQNADQPISFIGHSGGGLVLTMLLTRESNLQKKFRRLVFVATQASGSALVAGNRVKLQLSQALSGLLGFVPGRFFGLGPHNEKYEMMKHWFRWNLIGKFLAKDGFDFEKNAKQIELPLLSLAGSGDRYIAPVEGCEIFFSAFGGVENSFVNCGLSTGFAEDYDHGRIMLSKAASREIWPLILKWIEK